MVLENPDLPAPNQRQKFWLFLKIIFSLSLLGLVISKLQMANLTAMARIISPWWLLPCFVTFGAQILAMARRYQIIIANAIRFDQVLDAVVLQTITTNLLLNMAGLASYLTILKSKYQVSLGQGVFSLLSAKFFDLVIWLLLLIVASWALWPRIVSLHALMITVILITAIGLVMALLLPLNLLTVFHRVLAVLRLEDVPFFKNIFNTLRLVKDQEYPKIYKVFKPLTGYSLLCQTLSCALFYCSLRSFGLTVELWVLVLIFFLTQLLMLVPIHVGGGLGVADAFLLYIFGLFGISEYTIAPVIICVRILLYFLTASMLLYFPLKNFVLPGD